MIRLLVALIAALIPMESYAWCGAVTFSGEATMGVSPGWITSLCCTIGPYLSLPNSFSYNQEIPAGTTYYMTEMHFQTKGLESQDNLPGGTYGFQTRRSYFVLNNLWTCTDHEGVCRFEPPIAIPGPWLFATNSGLIDNSTNPGGGTHFTSMINGFARDASCPWPQAVQGIPPGY
jgi:hypothetical protein